jgi:hypothetical protein
MPATSLRITAVGTVQGRKVSVCTIHAEQLDQLRTEDAPTAFNQRAFADKMNIQQRLGNHVGGAAWFGGLTDIEQARDLYRRGWPEGARRTIDAKDSIGDVVPAATERRRVRRFTDDGDSLRLDQVLAGDWDNAWESRVMAPMPATRTVSIACGFIAMADVSAEGIMWNAVQAIVLTDLLESAGYRVELRAVDAVDVDGRALHVVDMLLKTADRALDPDTVAATIGHAGVYRSLGFGAMCCQPTDTNHSLGSNPSSSLLSAGIDAAIAAGAIEPISYRLPRGDSQLAAVANIRRALADLHPVVAV